MEVEWAQAKSCKVVSLRNEVDLLHATESWKVGSLHHEVDWLQNICRFAVCT